MAKVSGRYKRIDQLVDDTNIEDTDLLEIYNIPEERGKSATISDLKASIINPTDDFMPIRKNSSGFEDAPVSAVRDISDVITNMVTTVDWTFPSGTINIGGQISKFTGLLEKGVTSLSDAGISALLVDRINGSTSLIPLAPITENLDAPYGVGGLFTLEAPTFEWGEFGGGDNDNVTISGNQRITVSFTQLGDAYNVAQRLRGLEGKLHYKVFDTTLPPNSEDTEILVYSSTQGEPIDFDNPVQYKDTKTYIVGEYAQESGINYVCNTAITVPEVFTVAKWDVISSIQYEYQTINPNFLRLDHILRLEFFSADGNPVTVRGDIIGVIPPTGGADLVNVFVPFFGTKFTLTEEKLIATQEWVTDGFAEEAPEDGRQYTRKNGLWEQNNSNETVYSPTGLLTSITSQGAIDELEDIKVDEAPTDSKQYARIDESWVENNANATAYSPTGLLTSVTTQGAIDELEDVKVDEAPANGNLYSRKDELWVQDNALDTTYDNSTSLLNATNVQTAIDEVDNRQDVFGFMYLAANATQTSGVGVNKVAGTYGAPAYLSDFTHATGTLTYTGIKTITTVIDVSVACVKSAFSFEEYDFVCIVGGVIQPQKGCSSASNNTEPSSVNFQVPVQLTTGDTIEVLSINISGNNPFTVSEMQVSVGR